MAENSGNKDHFLRVLGLHYQLTGIACVVKFYHGEEGTEEDVVED